MYNAPVGKPIELKDGARVAIIGGGPAGSFFAHFILKYAERIGRKLSVFIFDGKDFLEKGPSGCNLCAGIIAQSLAESLAEEGLFLPEKRILNRVDGYTLYLNDIPVRLDSREVFKDSIATVFRGNGPRFSHFPENISFDDFLLTWAQDRGAELIREPVRSLNLPSDPSKPVSLQYGQKGDELTMEADLVVGAFGLNTSLLRQIEDLGFGYKPPEVRLTYQAEVYMGRERIREIFQNTIQVFIPSVAGLRYAMIIPKDDYVTITLIARKNASKSIFKIFMNLPSVKALFPEPLVHCHCRPKILHKSSHNPYTDRLVLIGDASYSRHYKNGISSALMTARMAAKAAVFKGVDRRSLARYYHQPARLQIVRDNRYGRLLFTLNDLLLAIPILSRVPGRLAQNRAAGYSAQSIRTFFWRMLTGNIPYRDIFLSMLDFKLQIHLLRHTIKLLFQGDLSESKTRNIQAVAQKPGSTENR